MAQEWGRQNDTRVTVDIIPVEEIRGARFRGGQGKQRTRLYLSSRGLRPNTAKTQLTTATSIRRLPPVWSNPATRAQVDIHSRNKTYFAFADFWVPSPLHFFQDHWAEVGMPLGPVHYGSLRGGGKNFATSSEYPAVWRFPPDPGG